ncbi:MAG: DegV family protein [Firmicutes bacterium]|jgi:EDD domain protein, degV family|nr:DegV family protein [Bacillota bacterium]
MIQFDVSSDSTCDLYKEYREERRIWFAPLTFTLDKNGKQEEGLDEFSCYQDYIDFYKKVEDGAFPRTSMLNYEAHLEHFRKMAAAGVKDVLHFSISSGLARTVTVAKQAAEEIKKEYPEFNLYSVDPLTATIGQGMLVSLACDCRDKGMSAQETYDYLMDVRLRIQHCIIPNDLFYLKKGGRVSAVSAVFGTALNIKPMIVFDTEGKLKVIDKCRGMKKAFNYVLESQEKAPMDEKKFAVIVHTDNETGANELADMVEARWGVRPQVVIMGPVIGAHVGPGSVSCGWLSTKTRKELTGC